MLQHSCHVAGKSDERRCVERPAEEESSGDIQGQVAEDIRILLSKHLLKVQGQLDECIKKQDDLLSRLTSQQQPQHTRRSNRDQKLGNGLSFPDLCDNWKSSEMESERDPSPGSKSKFSKDLVNNSLFADDHQYVASAPRESTMSSDARSSLMRVAARLHLPRFTSSMGSSNASKYSVRRSQRSRWSVPHFLQRGASTCIKSRVFNYIVLTTIVLNTLFVGLEVEYHQELAKIEGLLFRINCTFAASLIIEIALRLVAGGQRYFAEDKAWNIFDFSLLLLALLDMFVEALANMDTNWLSTARAIRVLRLLRAFRLVRSMRHIREFQKMVFALQASSSTLIWSMVLIVLFIYTFAVIFTQGAVVRLGQDPRLLSPKAQTLHDMYGSLGRSFYSLYLTMSGGLDWGEAMSALEHLHWIFRVLYFIFISVCIFGVLNVVTSVFVESAMTSAQHYRDLIIQESIHNKNIANQHLKQVFMTIDEDEDNCVTQDEMERFLGDPELCMYLESLDLVANDARVLFKLLDRDASGVIDIDEFCDGCMRLKGEAKSFDVHCMIYESSRLMTKWSEFMEYTEERLNNIDEYVTNQRRSSTLMKKCKPPPDLDSRECMHQDNDKKIGLETWGNPGQWVMEDADM